MKSLIRHLARRWPALCVLATVLLLASTAFAYGRVQWKSTRVKENVVGTQSNWKLEITVYLPKAPDFAHVPFKFVFKPTVYYERYRDDSSPEPQTRKVPTPGAQDIIESVDLGFLDPGTGKIENRTRFAFKITRAHGFEAGEYRVTIRNARTGAVLGTPITLYLEGENEIIDRRAMVFADKEEKKDDKKDSEEAGDDAAQEDVASDDGSMDWQEVSDEEEPLPPPEPLKKKRNCGCRTVGAGGSDGAGLALALLLGLGLIARRRRTG